MTIIDKENVITEEFLNYLLCRICKDAKLYIDRRKTGVWDEYLNREIEDKKKQYDTRKLILLGLKYLTIQRYYSEYIISIDTHKVLPNNKDIKLSQFCNLINYGTLSQKGYPIFTDIFTAVQNNLDIYKLDYALGV